MTEIFASHTVEHYRCSGCFGFLVLTFERDSRGEFIRTEGGDILCSVVCRRDQIDIGFVTKHFVERTQVKDFDQSFEVKRDLVKMGVVQKEATIG